MLYMEAAERVKREGMNARGANSRLLALPEGFWTNRTEGDCFGKPSHGGFSNHFSLLLLFETGKAVNMSFHILARTILLCLCLCARQNVCVHWGVCVFVHACVLMTL